MAPHDVRRGGGGVHRRRRRLPAVLTPSRSLEPELMDSLEDGDLLAGNLADLARVNHWLGGASLTQRGLERLVGGLPPGSEVSILDVATGGGDIPRAVARWCRDRDLEPRIVATDVNERILSLASALGDDAVSFQRADARSLPFADGAFDVAMCSFALHHFDVDDAVLVLSEMGRVARRGIVVNDLVRCWHGYAGALALGRIFTRNRVTRHDGALSVRRAYTRDELDDLLRRAGLVPRQVDGFLGYRLAITAGATP